MPIHYVNPARRRKPTAAGKRAAAARRGWEKRRKGTGPGSRAMVLYRPAPAGELEDLSPPKRRKKKSSKKTGLVKRKSKSVAIKKKKTAKKRSSTSMTKRKSAKRVAAGKKAAKTRKRNLALKAVKRRAAGKKAAKKRTTRKTVARRRRSSTTRVAGRRGRAIVTVRVNPAKRRRRRRYLSNPGRKMRGARSLGSIRKARRTILNVKRRARKGKGGLAAHYMRRYHMRSNPTSFKDAMQKAAPYLISLLASQGITVVVSRLLPASVSGALNVGGYDLTKPAVSAATTGLVFMVTKKGALAKYRFPAVMMSMVHLGYTLAQTFLPASIKGYVGMGDSGMYDRALSMGEYVTVNGMGEYVTVNGMGEYVQVGDDLMAEMGTSDIMAEMGVMEDLGRGFDDRGLGGVHRNDMLRALPPARSYLKTVGPINYNENVYTGIFSK